MYYIRALFFFTLVILTCCKNNSELRANKQEEIKMTTLDSLEPNAIATSIYGKSYEKNAKLKLNVIEYSQLFGSQPREIEFLTDEDGDSVSIIVPDLKGAKIMDVHLYAPSYYRTRIFVTPGDSIYIEIKNDKMSITGTHPEHYNFYLEMDQEDNQYALEPYKNDLADYKRNIESVNNSREKSLNDYISKNNVSEEFIDFFRSELEYEMLYNLLAPRTGVIAGTNTYYNSSLELSEFMIQEHRRGNSDKLFNLSSYLNNPEIEDFQKEEYIDNDYFKRSLSGVIRNYLTNHEYLEYSEKNYEDELAYIEKNLKGEIRNMAKAKLVFDYYGKGFGKDSLSSIKLRETINDIQESTKNISYVEEMNKIIDNLDVLEFDIPEHILNEKLITYNKDTISLGAILKSNNNNKLLTIWGYNDLCHPCREGIKRLYSLKSKSVINSDIDIFYISVEDSFETWKKEVKNFGLSMESNKSFKLLNDNMKSNILKYFNVRYGKEITLPRYTVIDDKKGILHNNFVNPNDSIAFKTAIKRIGIK